MVVSMTVRARPLLVLACILAAAAPARAASVSKTYSYFSIGGSTLDEIEKELVRRGPQVKSTGKRHPGATRMEFTTRIAYAERARSCSVVSVTVTVKARMILPRWRPRAKADGETRLVWDTLSSDIRRHEESHVVIAKNYARELETTLKGIGRKANCEIAAARAKAVSERVLSRHDRAQDEFDRVEGINFESRLVRLLRYRMERIEADKKPDKTG
jgi:predicted secreted Zn-dependent protease